MTFLEAYKKSKTTGSRYTTIFSNIFYTPSDVRIILSNGTITLPDEIESLECFSASDTLDFFEELYNFILTIADWKEEMDSISLEEAEKLLNKRIILPESKEEPVYKKAPATTDSVGKSLDDPKLPFYEKGLEVPKREKEREIDLSDFLKSYIFSLE